MQVRTSTTHPLRIDFVEAPGRGGKIGMTLFPGRRDRLSAVAPWDRDLETDLAVVREWHPAIVVSLVEKHEFALLRVPGFDKAMRAFSKAEKIAWMHLPIADGGVPNEDFEAAWISAGRTLRTALIGGGRVLLHCRAGLGRTGMIAARLLVELGVRPKDAIAQVRAARADTIETRAQERHVREQHAIEDDRPCVCFF